MSSFEINNDNENIYNLAVAHAHRAAETAFQKSKQRQIKKIEQYKSKN